MTIRKPSRYEQLVQRAIPPEPPDSKTVEVELDNLITRIEEDEHRRAEAVTPDKPDPIAKLREKTLRDLIPAFVELAEKYGKKGIALQMDAANFLQGGREIRFEFSVGEYRSQLHGTVTSEAIAFHEVKNRPNVQGELVSGPWLRLRGLTTGGFREFVCERLALLVRTAAKRP